MSVRPQGFSDSSASRGRSPALIPITRFGKYTLVARLGRGGMAEVFLGFVSGPAGFRKPIVIKRLLADLQGDERLVQMFFDEARLVARLQHPHVVQTYEVGVVEDSHFLAMEYLEGQPLHRLLRVCSQRHMRVPPPIAARIAIDALDGLAYAHDLRDYDGTPLDVVHRDVSPQNIFVTYDGVVKVLDFGIAKSVTQVVQTRTGAIKGKYAYISPEQARGNDIDARADIWAMGVVLWESLVGTRLFKGESDIATLEASLRAPIPRLAEAIPGSAPQLDAICTRALQRDREQRYTSALQMKEDLEAYLRQQPAPVSRGELARYTRKLFADVIDDHRRLLSVCMEQVRTGEIDPGDGNVEQAPETVPETPPSLDSYVRSAAGHSEVREPRRKVLPWVGLAALLVTCTLGGALAAFVAGGGTSGASFAEPSRSPALPEPPQVGRIAETGPGAESAAAIGAETVDDTATETVVAVETELEAGPEHEADPAPEADPVPEAATVPDLQRRRARRAIARTRAPMATATQTMTAADSPATAPDPPTQATGGLGRLTLDTVPWSEVSLDGRVLGTTPLLGHELPAGVHILTLRNPEQGIETQYRVRIAEGETTTRRLGL